MKDKFKVSKSQGGTNEFIFGDCKVPSFGSAGHTIDNDRDAQEALSMMNYAYRAGRSDKGAEIRDAISTS
jgi:hypothetical protein